MLTKRGGKMTKEIEIKEAVEILNNDTTRIQILSDFADKEYCGQALQVLIDLAQQYLKAEMPEEKTAKGNGLR
jgi:hypothetical protein